jgi:hypothetical protein
VAESDDDLEAYEDPDEPENYESDETVPCPYCRELIHEESQRCPACGHYKSKEDAPRRRPWWLVVGVIACLAVVALWYFRMW